MNTRDETFGLRLTRDEKVRLLSDAANSGMGPGDYARWRLFSAPPTGQAPVYASSSSPPYDQLAHQHTLLMSTISNMAQTDDSVARALDQARAALESREEKDG